MRIIKTFKCFAVIPFLLSMHANAEATGPCMIIRTRALFDSIQGTLLRNAEIRIEGGRIKSVGSGFTNPVAKECVFKDLSDHFVLPGLIDAHTHVLLEDRSYAADFSGELVRSTRQNDVERLSLGRRTARDILLSGFTTVRDLGNSGRFLDLRLRDEINKGATPGPMMLVSGPGLATGTAQFRQETSSGIVLKEYEIVHDPTQARNVVRRWKELGVDWIKVYADNGPNPARMPAALLREIVFAAHELRLKVAAHAETIESVIHAAEAGVDSIEHADEITEKAILPITRHNTHLVPTDFNRKLCSILNRFNPAPWYSDPEKYIQSHAKRLLLAKSRGLSIVFGSDIYLKLDSHGLDRGKASLQALYSYVEQGLSPTEALRSATHRSAQMLGLEKEVGWVGSGAQADLIALKGDPLRNIQELDKVDFVMKNGKIYRDL